MPQNARIYEKVHLKFPIHVMQTDEKLGLSIEKSQEPSNKDGVKLHQSHSMAKDEFKVRYRSMMLWSKFQQLSHQLFTGKTLASCNRSEFNNSNSRV